MPVHEVGVAGSKCPHSRNYDMQAGDKTVELSQDLSRPGVTGAIHVQVEFDRP